MKRPCNTHELKIFPRWFEDVMTGKKNFEIRKNDRDFKEGDYLLLKEWEKGRYIGREIRKEIQYVYYGDGTYGLSEDYCILGLKNSPQVNITMSGNNNTCIGYIQNYNEV